MNNAAWTWECKSVSETLISFPLEIYPEVGLLDCTVVLFLIFSFNFVRNLHTVFHNAYTNFHSHQQCTRVPFFPHLANTCYLFDNNHPNPCEVYLSVVFMYISLMFTDIQHIFMLLLAIWISSLDKCLLRSLAHFLIRLFDYFSHWVVWVPYIHWILIPFQLYGLQIFLLFCRLPFLFVDGFPCCTEAF